MVYGSKFMLHLVLKKIGPFELSTRQVSAENYMPPL